MSDPRLDLVIEDGVATLIIKRPDKLNALDADMVDSLLPLCRQIERSDAFVVILTGEGDKSFCAGGDIAAWSPQSADEFARHWVRDGHTAFDALARLSQPVIAVLNGHCFGGGIELAACADYRIAESHVKLGQPESALGIVPGWSGTQRAVRRFGQQLVRRMAIFGDVFTAEEALQLGLVDRVVAKGEGLNAADEHVERMRGRSPRATELVKMMINAAEGEDRERVIEAFAGNLSASSNDLKEGIAAFREKRKPIFKKKS
jgi:enoyl-CoA hydratase/carnithine racemase